MYKLGAYVTRLRESKCLSQRDLAAKIGRTPTAIQKLEAGTTIDPGWALMCELSDFFRVPLEKFKYASLGRDPDQYQEVTEEAKQRVLSDAFRKMLEMTEGG
jgi:transcriptional regulator with XRE-family HTH domain